jgi:hypothetical protein
LTSFVLKALYEIDRERLSTCEREYEEEIIVRMTELFSKKEVLIETVE